MVVYSGSNTDCKSSEPLKTLVMLAYVMLTGQFRRTSRAWVVKACHPSRVETLRHRYIKPEYFYTVSWPPGFPIREFSGIPGNCATLNSRREFPGILSNREF